MGHVGEELRLVARGHGQLLGLLLQHVFCILDLGALLLDLRVLLRELIGLLLQLCVGALQLVLLALQLVRERLRLAQQAFSAAVGLDVVEHHPDAVSQLVEEVLVRRAERLERRELQDCAHVAFEEDREDHDVQRRRLTKTRRDAHVVGRNVGEQDSALLDGALADQAFAEMELAREALARLVGVTGLEDQIGLCARRVDHAVESTVLGIH